MNSTSLASWIQVATGLAALILSVLTGLPALRGIQAVDATAPLSGLATAQSAVIVFAIFIVFAIGMIFIVIGISALLTAAFRAHEAKSPVHAAYCVTLAGFLLAAAATLAVVGASIWIFPALAALLCVILAGQAQADPGKETFWILAVAGCIGIFAVTTTVTALEPAPDQTSTAQPSASSTTPAGGP